MDERTPTLDEVLLPVSAQHPAGFFDEEDETFQAIDQEMVKLGGLREPSLDWAYIDEASRQFLTVQCKHYRIVSHLVTALLRSKDWADWAQTLALITGMVSNYWETAYPKPGPTGYLFKRKMIGAQIERVTAALDDLSTAGFAAAHHQAAQASIDVLQASAVKTGLDVPTLTRLETQLAKLAAKAQLPPEPAPAPKAPGQHGGQTLSPEFFSTKNDMQLGNERESRRTLLNVADFVNQHDQYDPAGYQLRRFALWSTILSAPAIKREQRTELMCVPVDIVRGYQENLASNSIDPGLLQRVEKSVASSPFWVRGSLLAAMIATRLEMKEVAAAIRYATERFVRRIPTLRDLQFSDGAAFIDADTQIWLSGADAVEPVADTTPEYAALRSELLAQLDTEGVEVVLRRLQDIQTKYSTPRQRCYATVMAADVLASRGLSWLANGLYASVSQIMHNTSAEQWEPDMYTHLIQRGQSPAVIPHGSKS